MPYAISFPAIMFYLAIRNGNGMGMGMGMGMKTEG